MINIKILRLLRHVVEDKSNSSGTDGRISMNFFLFSSYGRMLRDAVTRIAKFADLHGHFSRSTGFSEYVSIRVAPHRNGSRRANFVFTGRRTPTGPTNAQQVVCHFSNSLTLKFKVVVKHVFAHSSVIWASTKEMSSLSVSTS